MFEVYINDKKTEQRGIYNSLDINGVYRSGDFPSIIKYNKVGTKVGEWYYKNGKVHRDNDLPAIITYFTNGNVKANRYFKNGKLHRKYGYPAVINHKMKSGKISYEAYALGDIVYKYSIYKSGKPSRVITYDHSNEHGEFYAFVADYKEFKLEPCLYLKNENALIREFCSDIIGI